MVKTIKKCENKQKVQTALKFNTKTKKQSEPQQKYRP